MMVKIIVGIRMGDFGWLGFGVMGGEKVVEYDGGEAQKQEDLSFERES